MRSPALVSIVAAVLLTHAGALDPALAQAPAPAPGGERATPVPVAKPASPAPIVAPAVAAGATDVKATEGKGPEGEAKPGEGVPASRSARASGPLPVGSGERAFNAPDCQWTGERVIHTLMRDEVDTASQLTRFYSMFGCPTPHIGLALSCMVEREREQGPQHEKIKSCWTDPNVSRTAAAPAPEAAKEPAKPAAEDKPPQKN